MSAEGTRPAAVVTGSSSGIGRACAVELAKCGWDVVVHGLEADAGLAETIELVGAEGGTAVPVAGDMREPSVAEALVSNAVERFGRLDGVVSNAGTGLTKAFGELGDDDWATLLETHLLGATRLLRAAHPHLVAAHGAVVTMSSLAAGRALTGRAGYGATKAALEGLTRQLAAEWAPDGVRVNAIAPGTILTPLVRTNFARGLLDEGQVLQRTPLGRLGAPREIATAARFLLSRDASYITGQTLSVDGGWSIWGGWS
ncbi:SDR family NAD(P)-dependent oxidoreductase [Amycolatopsis sp. CA-161197]|uniref:SDR family NAD(P)-dependent oxidoreductase n=1 Tax=Amycolatopsis sp. CA-161197 TaxID=3239922 RepID=UPI003D8CC450